VDANRRFYDEYNRWLDLRPSYYLTTIRIVFRSIAYPTDWHIHGKRVAPEGIRNVALFTIEGELDDISGSGQTGRARSVPRNSAGEPPHLTGSA